MPTKKPNDKTQKRPNDKTTNGSTQILIRLPNELVNQLRTIAEQEDRSVTQQVQHIVKNYLNNRNNSKGTPQ